jgi:perosamine synthetase
MIHISSPKLGFTEVQNVINVIKSGILAQGETVKQFEEEFAKFIGTKYAVAVNNGTSALHAAYIACGIQEGDEVITTPFTFVATINMIKACGAKPVYVDIKDDFNIDEAQIEARISNKTKAIVPVHLFGKSCNMDAIMKLAKKYKLKVIEDCAQSCGSEYKNKKVGTFGDCGTFSFYPTKIISTGEGGMVTTNSQKIYEKLLLIRNHGKLNTGYDYKDFGYNYRMSNVHAAIGLAQLEKIEQFLRIRENIADWYNFGLSEIISVPLPELECRHVYNNYSFCVKNRDMFIRNMRANGIDVRVYYPEPFADLPNALRISKEIVSIPIRADLTTEEVTHIIDNIENVVKK